jgi:molybdopterin-guanine dinucleotide biosynthesis protein A
VDALIINANRELARYQSYGCAVISDEIAGFAGPLAGLQAGLQACNTAFICTVPCDSPFLPADLVRRLMAGLLEHNADIAVVKTLNEFDKPQAQPVFLLCKTTLLANLTNFLQNGGRKIDAWYSTLNFVEVDFCDCPQAFANFNTLPELQAAQK